MTDENIIGSSPDTASHKFVILISNVFHLELRLDRTFGSVEGPEDPDGRRVRTRRVGPQGCRTSLSPGSGFYLLDTFPFSH